jgi:hypothetical protein
MHPSDTNRITFPKIRQVGTHCGDDAGHLVSRNKRRRRCDRAITIGRVQILVTHSAGHRFDKQFASSRHRYRYILDHERLDEFTHNRSFHRLANIRAPHWMMRTLNLLLLNPLTKIKPARFERRFVGHCVPPGE